LFDYRKSKEKYNRKNKYPGVIEVGPGKQDLDKYTSDNHSRSPKSTANQVAYSTHQNNFNQVNQNFFTEKRLQGAQGLK